MTRSLRLALHGALLSTAFALGACAAGDDDAPARTDTASAAQSTVQQPAPPAPAPATAVTDSASTSSSDMRIEVDLKARQLSVYRGGSKVATHAVAVGSEKWPTQTGEWRIAQVVFNPEWIPPDESWAEEREPRQPGDPKNPLGRAQLVYDPPRTIHGTNQPSSIGKAVSHGSIRLPNEVIVQLAREVMEASGAGKDEAWYRRAQENRREKQVVDLPRPVPIRVF